MSGFLLVLASIVGYLTVGALYARSQAVAQYERLRAKHRRTTQFKDLVDEWTQRDIIPVLGARVAFWPFLIPFDAVRGPLRQWLTRPLDERRAEAEQLRKDADVWASQARSEHDTDKRIMAEELARMLREQAKEVDL